MNLHVWEGRLIIADITEGQRKTGQSRFPVLDRQNAGDGGVQEKEVRQMTAKFKSSQAVFRRNARDQDEAQHHGQKEIKQIVPCINGRNTDRQREDQKLKPF